METEEATGSSMVEPKPLLFPNPKTISTDGAAGEGDLVALLTTVCLLVVVRPLQTFPQCDHHHGGCHQSFVPAPPGKTPECARPGSTFCENIEHYPTHLIHYLVERNGYNVGSLLVDESLNDFRPRPVYGPPPPPPSYGPPLKYYPANTTTGWYPDRPKFPHIVGHGGPIFYTTAWQPAQYWWQSRYARSNQESSAALNPKTHPRKKRQVGAAGSGATQLCPTMKRYIQPKAAMNDKGNWMYVVNLGDVNPNFTQLVVAETCTSFRCNGLCSIPNGYTSRCEQQYVQKRLVALESGGNRLYQDTFWFPHCCICQITPANSG